MYKQSGIESVWLVYISAIVTHLDHIKFVIPAKHNNIPGSYEICDIGGYRLVTVYNDMIMHGKYI